MQSPVRIVVAALAAIAVSATGTSVANAAAKPVSYRKAVVKTQPNRKAIQKTPSRKAILKTASRKAILKTASRKAIQKTPSRKAIVTSISAPSHKHGKPVA